MWSSRRKPSETPTDHVVEQRPAEAVQRSALPLVVGAGDGQAAVLMTDRDAIGEHPLERAL